jgi:hypothetical protein
MFVAVFIAAVNKVLGLLIISALVISHVCRWVPVRSKR